MSINILLPAGRGRRVFGQGIHVISSVSCVPLIFIARHAMPTHYAWSYMLWPAVRPCVPLSVCLSVCLSVDDTYIIVPTCNIQSREAELDHVAKCAHANNLKLNREKSAEIVITRKRQRQDYNPPELPGICRTTSLTILGVNFTNHLSISDHITNVISKCAQSLYALEVLRSHGLSD